MRKRKARISSRITRLVRFKRRIASYQRKRVNTFIAMADKKAHPIKIMVKGDKLINLRSTKRRVAKRIG